MHDKLASIGFYTLKDERARHCSSTSPLCRCELLINDRCNFNCPYCRKRSGPDINPRFAFLIINGWCEQGLKNIRFSGGEPTLNGYLGEYVFAAKHGGVERIAVSTNGSAQRAVYEELINAGVNDFSVSLDACCASTGDTMAGVAGMFERVKDNIKFLSSRVYTTVGVVLTDTNAPEIGAIIQIAHDLGVVDIRVIPAAQDGKVIPPVHISPDILKKHPILKYRIDNLTRGLPVRGLAGFDTHKCPLVLDDMAMDEAGNHYPCMRERGAPIGQFCGDMKKVRQERLEWSKTHDTWADPICKNNCLDVCVEYNNMVIDINQS
jgi:MoaA/NifB/PqqE/SkfB family radical SAM enzyme